MEKNLAQQKQLSMWIAFVLKQLKFEQNTVLAIHKEPINAKDFSINVGEAGRFV